jgi:signal peptidase I
MQAINSSFKGNRKYYWLQFTIAFFVLIILITFIKVFYLGFYRVNSSSMLPTLQIGDMVLVDKHFYKQNGLNKGDIVFFHQNNTNKDLVKRIFAIEGDTVLYLNDNLYVNNLDFTNKDEFNEKWLSKYKKVIVEKGRIFLIGDNLNISSDSRDWGTIEESKILGKISFIYFSKDSDGFHFDRIGNNLY